MERINVSLNVEDDVGLESVNDLDSPGQIFERFRRTEVGSMCEDTWR
jgi:hypothetical protein